jgi:hypothetical protein
MPPAASPGAVILSPGARGYTRAVPAQQIASNLAYINWTVLTGLAVGAYAVAMLARWRTAVTPGYVRFTVICALIFGGLAWLSDGALPANLGESPVVANPAFDVPRRAALAAFVVIGAVDIFILRNRPISRYAGPAALLSGLLVLAFGALAWGSGSTLGLLFQLAFLAASIGGVFAAMILGHWYLVTPKLPEAPLVLVSRLLLVVIAAQVALFAVWIATGAGPADVAPFAALTGSWAFFVWMRLIIGLIFPLIVSYAAIQTARTRSMESATGLLYINVGTIAAGTILAAGLYFGAGLLV